MQHPTILLYGHGGKDNRGCEAIAISTTALIHSARPDARIEVASLRAEGDRTVGIPGVSRIVPHGIKPLSVDRLINSINDRIGADRDTIVARTQAPMLRAARQADVCLSVGGDTYCYTRPEMLYVVNRQLARMGKPAALWGCSIEPVSLNDAEMLADLSSYRAIFARESITYAALKDAGLPAVSSADPAFTLAPELVDLPEGFLPGNTIGLNISPLALEHAQDAGRAMEGVTALIRHILHSTDSVVALLPHVRWPHDDDMRTLSALKVAFAEEPRVLLLDRVYTAPRIKHIIAQMRCLIAARTHASIAAYSTGVPTLVLGYSVKARGIARDLYGDEAGHVLPVQEISSAAELTRAFDALIAGERAERALLNEAAPKMREKVAAAVDTILSWTEARA